MAKNREGEKAKAEKPAFKPAEGVPSGTPVRKDLGNVPANETPVVEDAETIKKREDLKKAEQDRARKIGEENKDRDPDNATLVRRSPGGVPSTRDRALRGELDAPVNNSIPGDFRDSSQHPAVEERHVADGVPLSEGGKKSKGQPLTNRGATAQQSNSLQRPEGAPAREAEKVSGEDTGGADAPKGKVPGEGTPKKKKKKKVREE